MAVLEWPVKLQRINNQLCIGKVFLNQLALLQKRFLATAQFFRGGSKFYPLLQMDVDTVATSPPL